MLLSFIVSALLLASPALAATPEEWAARSVYQVVTDRFAMSSDSASACDTSKRTYCGGSWAGVTRHLDYIQNMGFDAVWISPIVENIDGTAYGDGYHGYWMKNFDKLSSRFGSAEDLKALCDALHKRGMLLMIDVVVNHCASNPTKASGPHGLISDFSLLQPLSSESDYHPQCFITDYKNQTDVEQCWLGDPLLPLPDINQEDPAVANTLYAWIEKLVGDYGADGVRIDTVRHVPKDFLASFSKSAGVFTLGEVLHPEPAYVEGYIGAVDAVLDYPTYYTLITAFGSTSGNLSALEAAPKLGGAKKSAGVVSAAFLENHDQPRFASYTGDASLTRNAMTWPFVGDGLPIMYYGQEQGYQGGGDPSNREALWLSGYETDKPLVTHVKSLNAARKLAIAHNPEFLTSGSTWIPQSNPSTVMLSKPPLLTLFTNIGQNGSTQFPPTWTIPVGLYPANATLVDVLTCTPLVNAGGADGKGTVVRSEGGMPQVLVPAGMLSATGGVCPGLATAVGGGGGSGSGAQSLKGDGPPGRVGKVVKAMGVVAAVAGVLIVL